MLEQNKDREVEIIRLKAELEKVKHNYQLLQEIAMSSEGGIYIVQDFKFVFNNSGFCNLIGYSAEELKSLNFIDIVHPNDKKLMKLLFQGNYSEIRQKQSSSYTFRVVTQSGAIKWLKSHVSVIEWEGKPALLDSCFDITLQKDTETKLIDEEQNFRLLVNTFDDFVFVLNIKGNIIQTNQPVINILGYREHELLLKPFEELLAKPNDLNVNKIFESVQKRRKESFSTFLVSKKQLRIPAEVRMFKGVWSGRDVVFVICQDITQKVKAEKAIKLSEEKFSKAFNTKAVMMAIVTFNEGRFIDVNEAFLQGTGLKQNEVVGRTINDVDIFVYSNLKENLLKQIFISERFSEQEVQIKNVKCEILTCLFSAEEVFIQGEKCLLIVMSDITQRKKVEKELILAKTQAEEASKAKEQFLSTMSHEIRTPMNAVIGMTNLLIQEHPKPEQIANLNALKYSAESLLALLNDILDFSKIEAGKIEIVRETFDLRLVIEGIKHTYDLTAKNKGINLLTAFDERIPYKLIGDPIRINQVLTNLVGNAIKFTEIGSVGVACKLEQESEENAKVLFSIVDTGIGIEEEKQRIIFQEFTQANAQTTRKYGGTGLGLAISQRIVKMLGGEIKVESELGKGARFFFSLKLAKLAKEIPESTQAVMSESKAEFSKQYRVLIVEDNDINKIIAEKFLTKWGLIVEHAENGKVALEKHQSGDFDLILMDLEMPVMSGYEATVEIRKMRDEKKRNTPIIALTASAMLDIQNKIYNLGMNDFILKPFVPNDLRRKLLHHLEKPDK